MKQQQYRGFGLILSVVLMVIVVSTLFSRNNDALSEQEYYQALEAERTMAADFDTSSARLIWRTAGLDIRMEICISSCKECR